MPYRSPNQSPIVRTKTGKYNYCHLRIKKYPDELIATARMLYESGLSQRETARALGKGLSVTQRILVQAEVEFRKKADYEPRSGAEVLGWKGDDASYVTLHKRLRRRRGPAIICYKCGDSSARIEWANQTGRYHDLDDYKQMCPSCHKKFDFARIRATGQSTRGKYYVKDR